MEHEPLRMEVIIHQDEYHIVLIGSMDHFSIAPLQQRIDHISQSLTRNVVINLCQVDYLDSAGIYLILAGYRNLKAVNKTLQLIVQIDSHPCRTLMSAKIDQILEISVSSEEMELLHRRTWDTAGPGPGVRRFTRVSNPDSLAEIRASIKDYCLSLGFPDMVTQDLQVAVSEAITNALVHGCPDETYLVDARWMVQDDFLVIQVRDYGPGFEVPRDPIMPGPSPLHGRGIPLMRMAADELIYQVNLPGTLVELRKKLPTKAG
jgi:serine/threonine-protein kinase RsbW